MNTNSKRCLVTVYFFQVFNHKPLSRESRNLITARKRSLQRLCFHRCLYVSSGGGEGLCSKGDLCPGGFLYRGVSVWGSLAIGVSVRETPLHSYMLVVCFLLEFILVNADFENGSFNVPKYNPTTAISFKCLCHF